MKVFITADIEGTAYTTCWDETERDKPYYQQAAREMTDEVLAACEGATLAGADEILIRDAHDYGVNIDPTRLKDNCELIRGWSGSPMSMVEGIDESFDAAMFVGWHSPGGTCYNPLSHTMTTRNLKATLNGMPCSEFLLYSWACAMRGVPSVLLTGDRHLTEISKALHPKLMTVAVKDGFGGLTRSKAPGTVQREIREAAQKALTQDLTNAVPVLPRRFTFEITYRTPRDAVRCSFYPGFRLVDDTTIRMTTGDYMAVLTAAKFCL